MVRGRCIAVTAVAPMNQCADTTRMPRGRGSNRPSFCQTRVYALLSSVFMGLPCPMKSEGTPVMHPPQLEQPCLRRSGQDCERRVRRDGSKPLGCLSGQPAGLLEKKGGSSYAICEAGRSAARRGG